MQVGSIHILSKSITLPIAWTLTSPNFILELPNGSFEATSIPLVSPASSTESVTHTLSSIVVPNMAGLYKGSFQFVFNSRTAIYPVEFWSTWGSPYTLIRELLGVSETDVSISRLDLVFFSMYSWLRSITNNALVEYYLLPIEYRVIFDTAMAYMICSKMRPSISGKASTGELTLFKKGTTTLQWSTGVKSNVNIEEDWWDMALLLLRGIPELASAFDRITYENTNFIMDRGELSEGNDHPTSPWAVSNRGSIEYPVIHSAVIASTDIDSWSQM